MISQAGCGPLRPRRKGMETGHNCSACGYSWSDDYASSPCPACNTLN
jgi:rubrerythrin